MGGPGAVIWRPSPVLVRECSMSRFRSWLASEGYVRAANYHELWNWSVTEVGEFWQAMWDFEEIVGDRGEGPALAGEMPQVRWFSGASLNYAEHLFRTPTSGAALYCGREDEEVEEWSMEELKRAAGSLARTLQGLGVEKGTALPLIYRIDRRR